MKTATIEAILEARSKRRTVCVVTDLNRATQFVIGKGDGQNPTPGHLSILSNAIQSALESGRTEIVEENGQRFFLQPFRPMPRIVIIGAVHIAQNLAPMASMLGYEIEIIDPRKAFAEAERFRDIAIDPSWPDEALARNPLDERAALVTLTHDPKLDEPALAAALRSRCFYIGALGSKRTHAARLESLRQSGFDDASLARIHGPAGIDIGALSPSEIALSIMAEIILAQRGKRRS